MEGGEPLNSSSSLSKSSSEDNKSADISREQVLEKVGVDPADEMIVLTREQELETSADDPGDEIIAKELVILGHALKSRPGEMEDGRYSGKVKHRPCPQSQALTPLALCGHVMMITWFVALLVNYSKLMMTWSVNWQLVNALTLVLAVTTLFSRGRGTEGGGRAIGIAGDESPNQNSGSDNSSTGEHSMVLMDPLDLIHNDLAELELDMKKQIFQELELITVIMISQDLEVAATITMIEELEEGINMMLKIHFAKLLKQLEQSEDRVSHNFFRTLCNSEEARSFLGPGVHHNFTEALLQVETDLVNKMKEIPQISEEQIQNVVLLPAKFVEPLKSMLIKGCSIEKQRASKLLDDAMKKGYVTSQHIVLVLTGIAGSGKSSFKRVILDLPPEEVRVSTPLAEAAVRNVSISRATATGSDSVKWEEVSSEELLEMVADSVSLGEDLPVLLALKHYLQTNLSRFHPNNTTHVPNLLTSQDDNTAHVPNAWSSQDHNVPHALTPSFSITPSISMNDNITFNITIKDTSTAQDSNATAQDCNITAQDSNTTAQDSNITHYNPDLADPLLSLIVSSQGSLRLFGVHWVYIIDAGGQPQFLRLLPAFIKNISACVCVVRLDQDLDHKPEIQFFDESGKQCGDSQQSERTNLQVIESCLRTIHTQRCLGSNSPPSCFVVGTHLDEYKKHPHIESIEEKNERLVTRLNPLLEKCLTFYQSGEECDKLIFPLNCKTPEQRDKEVAAEFRKCVMRQSREPEGKIPLTWFILEEHIRQHAAEKNVPYVEKEVCAKIARELQMSEEVFEAALDHLLKLNIFHCYPSLPNLIFCDSQVVLLKLTELVQYCFYLNTTAIGISGEDLSFKNEGIITLQFLSNPRFSKFHSKLFTPQNFLDILLSLLTVAHLQDEKYFMPCLLKELSEKEVSTHRTTSKSLSPLLIYIDQGCLPNGLFASLISSLKNNHGWSLAYQRGHKPKCLHQNCITFTLPGGIPGSVTLIESFSYLEIHLNCPIEPKVDNTCAKVFRDIKSGLEESWRVLYSSAGEISLKRAFFCSSCPSSLSPDDPPEARDHYATVSTCGEYETCSLVPDQGVVLCESKLRWLRNTNYIQMEPSAANIKSPGVGIPLVTQDNPNSDLQPYLSSLPDAASSCLDKLLDWDNDHDRDLITIAQHLLEWEELLALPFQLTATQISDIKEKYIYKPELQRRAVLETWKVKSALQATYRYLLKTLVEAKHMKGARAVCEVLKKISTTSRETP